MASPDPAAQYDDFMALVRQRSIDPAVLLAEHLPIPTTLAERLAQLDTLKAWLDSFRPLPVVVVEELRKYYTVVLTYNSNAIEGNTLTQNETEMVLSHGITVNGKSLVEHLEVTGHREAMVYMEELALADSAIGEWEIKNLHSLIMHPVEQASRQNEAGRYREVDVRAAGSDHRYPPPYRVAELMEQFAAWLYANEALALHPVEYAAQAHYRLVSIHPFRDGNGRTGRLLMNLCLLRAGYPITVITNAQRSRYIDSLVHAQNHGDDIDDLTTLIAEAARESFIEYLRMLSTAGDSRGSGELFYRDMLKLLKS